MSRVDAFPYPSKQDAYDLLATWLGVHVAAGDVYADQKNGHDQFHIVDVRPKSAYDRGTVPKAIHFPPSKWSKENCEQLFGAPYDSIVVVGWSWRTDAHGAATQLAAYGYPARIMLGGFEAWEKEGYPINAR